MNGVSPLVKWAGGKRWLVSRHLDLFPDDFDRLVEPFVGGASVFLKLRPRRAMLADANADLITTYKTIKSDWESVLRGLRTHQKLHSKEHYYTTRASRPQNAIETAIRFLYLNRTCWNGLYRVNMKGEFNVPIGTKDKVIMPDDDFEGFSRVLRRNVSLRNQDFRRTMKLAEGGDFVYVDPPYTVKHNKNGFLKYNESIFSWDDQVDLRDAVESAALRGAKVIVSQANHESIVKLYKGLGKIKTISRASVLASNSNFRGKVEEVLIHVNC